MAAVLADAEIEGFVHDGFVKVAQAFSRELAARCVDELWLSLDVDRYDPATWTEPIIRIPGTRHPDLVAAINTDRLTGAINDVLGGPHAWQPRSTGYGSFPVRFPSEVDPGDAGWHIDSSFGPAPDWLVNFVSRGRALLLLMLFSDVTENDAPTRIRVGSHFDVARGLAAEDSDSVAFRMDSHAQGSDDRKVVLATGNGGDVYICHPFLVHAATWPPRGKQPRFVAQPCIHHPEGEYLGGFDYNNLGDDSPVKRAVRLALADGSL